jgi:vacuolar-type H+-ATPase subunit C/Vma6
MIGYAEQLACVEREIAMRKRVYPRWIEAGKITKAKADKEIRTMEAVAETLRGLEQREKLI